MRFEPLRPGVAWSSHRRGSCSGRCLWVVALVGGRWLFDESLAVELGLLVTLASFRVSLRRGSARGTRRADRRSGGCGGR